VYLPQEAASQVPVMSLAATPREVVPRAVGLSLVVVAR
jgi:hypothetical protein